MSGQVWLSGVQNPIAGFVHMQLTCPAVETVGGKCRGEMEIPSETWLHVELFAGHPDAVRAGNFRIFLFFYQDYQVVQ